MSMQCFDSMLLCYHYMIATDQKLNSYATFDSGKRKWLNLRHDAAVVMLPDLCRVHRQMSRHHDEVFGIGPVWTRTRSRFPFARLRTSACLHRPCNILGLWGRAQESG